MLKLDHENYAEATAIMANALVQADDRGIKTYTARAGLMLEALGEVFDVEVVDPGPHDFEASLDAAMAKIREHHEALGAASGRWYATPKGIGSNRVMP
jgi:hypothetical protein